MWVYILTEPAKADNDYNAVYTVGFYDPDDVFQTDGDFTDREEAAKRVNYLNGGNQALSHADLLAQAKRNNEVC